MGLLFIQAVQFADIPVMAAYLCLIALIFVVINLVVDLLYFAVDPRLRIETGGRRALIADSLTQESTSMKRHEAPLALLAAALALAAPLSPRRHPARRQPGRRRSRWIRIRSTRALQLSFTGNVYEPLVGRDKKMALDAGAGDQVDADDARPSGASSCARASNSTTARRSPPTTWCSRSSARAGDGSDMKGYTAPIKEVRKVERLRGRDRDHRAVSRSCPTR